MTQAGHGVPFRRWLVTGGCGFIGGALLRRLLLRPDVSVRVVDNLTVGGRDDLAAVHPFIEIGPGEIPDWNSRLSLVEGDILDADLMLQAAQGSDAIVHLAANTGVYPSVLDPRQDCFTNVLGTLNMLEAGRHAAVRRFVFASSGAPVGECQPPIHEELPARPVSPYGASKLAGEGYCSAYCRTFGVPTVALRFGNVYGPGSMRKSSVVAAFIKQAAKGEPLHIFGDGRQTRDFIYIEDIVSAILAAARAEAAPGEIFQIATNREHSVLELATTLAARLENARFGAVTIEHGDTRPGDVARNFSDTAKARRLLAWEPAHALAEGLDQTIRWFVEAGLLRGDGNPSPVAPTFLVDSDR